MRTRLENLTRGASRCAAIGMVGAVLLSGLSGCGQVGDVKPEEQAGYQVYQDYCGLCHERQSPKRHTAADWPEVVERMRIHMKEKKKGEITDKQAEDVLIFLKGHAGK